MDERAGHEEIAPMPSVLMRIKNIILHPSREWLVIKTEHSTYLRILTRYVAVLTLLPVLAITGRVIASLLRYSSASPIYRSSAEYALLLGLSWYLINILNVVIIGAVFQALFHAFAVSKDKVSGLKISAYSATPLWIAFSLTVIPHSVFQWLVLAALLYSFYLIYLAIVVVMDVPKKKAVWYALAAILASGVLVGIIDSAVIRLEELAVRA
jgi:hypothetical protein